MNLFDAHSFHFAVLLPTTAGVLLAFLVASWIHSVESASTDSGYSYPFCFFNITVGSETPIGVVEIYICSVDSSLNYLSVCYSILIQITVPTIQIDDPYPTVFSSIQRTELNGMGAANAVTARFISTQRVQSVEYFVSIASLNASIEFSPPSRSTDNIAFKRWNSVTEQSPAPCCDPLWLLHSTEVQGNVRRFIKFWHKSHIWLGNSNFILTSQFTVGARFISHRRQIP